MSRVNRFLLCTDLDQTLIPNGRHPESPCARLYFERMVKQSGISLAYVTGRGRALIEQAIVDFDLPQPDMVIGDVGTSIYRIEAAGWQRWEEWGAGFAADWHGMSHQQLQRLLSDIDELQIQELERQNSYKLSFYLPITMDTQLISEAISRRLNPRGIKTKLIYSVDETSGFGLLDILPKSAGKMPALRFLMQQCGFTRDNTVYGGDSGNDLEVLLSDIPSVLVANADEHTIVSTAQAGGGAAMYYAKGGYLGMNGNYSAGILEGVGHYWPEVDKILREMNLTKDYCGHALEGG